MNLIKEILYWTLFILTLCIIFPIIILTIIFSLIFGRTQMFQNFLQVVNEKINRKNR